MPSPVTLKMEVEDGRDLRIPTPIPQMDDTLDINAVSIQNKMNWPSLVLLLKGARNGLILFINMEIVQWKEI